MIFNLLTTHWLEARRASGQRVVMRPCDVTADFGGDPVVALDFPRPDWNAALTEFLIGLVFLALAPEGEGDWGASYRTPPTPEALEKAFAPFVSAFDLDGDGPRAFQDFDTLGNAEAKPLAGLLIEAPGENTLKNNGDLFNKRGGAAALGMPYAAAALITLQTYAPSGGAGHRTSMRGGGPLTTLLAPTRTHKALAPGQSTLWDRIWANVLYVDAATQNAELTEIFPWLAPTLTSEKSQIVAPEDRPAALAFFACPRRIRLILDDGICALSAATGRVATGFRTLNYGANYLHWQHPLSPYRNDKKAGRLPLHPHSGPSDYGDWVAWWGFKAEGDAPAEPLRLWQARERHAGHMRVQVEAFGFDMDNMKARQWLETRLPFVPVADDTAYAELRATIQKSVAGAEASVRALRFAVKTAIYGKRNGNGFRLPETLPMDAAQEPGFRFWRETQQPFEGLLGKLVERQKDGAAPTGDLLGGWLATLRLHVLRIFDETVDLDGMTNDNPRRLLHARSGLTFAFSSHTRAEVRKALDLAVPPKAANMKETA